MAELNLSSLYELSNKVCFHENEVYEFFSLANQVWFNFTEFNFPGRVSDRSLDWLDQFKIFLYTITFVVALVGNLVVLIAVLNYRTLRGAINLYLANLAVADLLICLCCMWVHLVNHLTAPAYILGPFICKINGFVQMTCLTSSVLTLSAISCDRYMAVMFPLRSRVTKQRTDAVIGAIWFFSLLISTPFLMYRRLQTLQWSDYTETNCLEAWPSSTIYSAELGACVQQHFFKRVYYTLISTTLFFVPVLIMLTAYSAIIWKLSQSPCPASLSLSGQLSALRHKAKRKITKMSIAILLVFVLCWLPLQMTVLYSIYLHSSHSDGVLPEWFGKLSFVSTYLAYSNSVFNPLIYGRFSRRFRVACRSIVSSVLCCLCTSILELNKTEQNGKEGHAAVASEGEGRHMQQLRRRQLRVGRCESTPVGTNIDTCLNVHSSSFFIPLMSSLSVPHSDRSPKSSVVSLTTTDNHSVNHSENHSVHSAAVFALSPTPSSQASLHTNQPDRVTFVGRVPLAHNSSRKFCFSFLRSL